MSSEAPPLEVVDAYELAEPYRAALRPGALVPDRRGQLRRLPRFFYAIESAEVARSVMLAPHFALWEFVDVDVREAPVLRGYPKYVPCAISLLATHLEIFREKVKTYVRIAANGAYRSPSHVLSTHASPHLWGTAANIFRIGSEYLDDEEKIERYGALATKCLPTLWARPYGGGPGFANDHLHLDLGYVTVVPREAPGEDRQRERGG